jgi:hypothetical protein
MLEESAMKASHNQQGLALLVLIFILVLVVLGFAVRSLDPTKIENEKNKKTAEALAQAKAALVGYAVSQDLTSIICVTNCARPGDLPCPDTNNDGSAETSCGNAVGTTGQASRLGRLPWRTLGLPDLRDGDGERLWYAVSNRYKYNTRFRPLNSDTVATITLRGADGGIVFDGVNNGVAAVVVAPRAAIVRQDFITQLRDNANQNIASNYLDIAFGEDNQNFVDSSTDGFIAGPIKDASGNVILNDQLLAITRIEINQAMESRVLAEVRDTLTTYYLGPGALSYPNPSNFNDATCLSNSDIVLPDCPEGVLTHGRFPANPIAPWGVASILRGGSDGNWFQLNAWREVVHYAVAPACITGTVGCSGVGMLTLNNSLPNNKQFVVIATGETLSGQARLTNVEKGNEGNYLEGENILPLDDVYVRTMPITATINDRVISLP